MATDGPYRVGNHSPINVWWDPHRDYATSDQVCMATTPEWGQRIVDALNRAEPMATDDLRDRIATEFVRHTYWNPGSCECGTWKADLEWDVDWRRQWRLHVAQSVKDFAVAPVLAERDAEIERTRIQLADALDLSHSLEIGTLLIMAAELMRAFKATGAENSELRTELAAVKAELEHARRALFVGIPRDVREAFTDAPLQRLAVEVSRLARRPATSTEQAPKPGDPAEPREALGAFVRQVWVEWAREQDDPKPSWLTSWDELDAGQREVDMRIGTALFEAGKKAAESVTEQVPATPKRGVTEAHG